MGIRERKQEITRTHIISTAMSLFRSSSFDKISMEQIASKSDVSKGTLYKYFPVKEAIVSSYWKNNVKQESDVISKLFTSYPNTKTRITAVFISAADSFKIEPEFARIQFVYQFQEIGRNPNNKQIRSGFEIFLEKILIAGQELGDVRKDILASTMAGQLLFLFTTTCLFWFSSPEIFSLEERLKETATIFIEGAQHV